MPDQRTVFDDVAAMLAGASAAVRLDGPGKSGARLERVTLDGEPYVVKYLDPAVDWTLRASGVPGGATVGLWRRGILDALPDCFEQPVIAVAQEDPQTAVLLMRDVGPWLVPEGSGRIDDALEGQFLDHMARLHAHFWETSLPIDEVSVERRLLELSPGMAEAEAARGSTALVPRLVAQGWPLFADLAPAAHRVVGPLTRDPQRLVAALARTPQTFVHGNWKLDNLGSTDQGRTVLLDWELPGRAAGLSDLAWYLAINCRRLATSKEEVIARYRDSLHRHGVDTAGWWEAQLGLCLLGAVVQFGWEKALGGRDEEFAWWEEQVFRAERYL